MARRAKSTRSPSSVPRSVPDIQPGVRVLYDSKTQRELEGISGAHLDTEARRLQHQRRDQSERQKLWLRWIALALAIATLGLLVGLEWFILCEMLQWAPFENSFFVVLAISPVVAATTIIVFLLIGVFRGFKDTDIDNLPVGDIARGAVEGS